MSDATTADDAPVLELLARMTADSVESSSLDLDTLVLVRIAALVAVDAAPVSYALNLRVGGELGLDVETLRGVLMAIAPIVGTAKSPQRPGTSSRRSPRRSPWRTSRSPKCMRRTTTTSSEVGAMRPPHALSRSHRVTSVQNVREEAPALVPPEVELDRQLLDAKLAPPRYSARGAVSRADLISRARSSARRMVSVTAPAGYGKSMLLARMGEQREAAGRLDLARPIRRRSHRPPGSHRVCVRVDRAIRASARAGHPPVERLAAGAGCSCGRRYPASVSGAVRDRDR